MNKQAHVTLEGILSGSVNIKGWTYDKQELVEPFAIITRHVTRLEFYSEIWKLRKICKSTWCMQWGASGAKVSGMPYQSRYTSVGGSSSMDQFGCC